MEQRSEYLARKEAELRRINEALESEFKMAQIQVNYSPTKVEDVLAGSDDEREEGSIDPEPYEQEEESKELPANTPVDESVDEFAAKGRDIVEMQEHISENESIIKYQKARITALQEELAEAMSNLNAQAQEIDSLRGVTSAATEDTKKQSAQFKTISDNFDRVKRQNQEANSRIKDLDSQISSLQKELALSKKTAKKADSDINSRETRINRLIEEVEKYKTIVKSNRANTSEKDDQVRKDLDVLQQENKRLERQKNELLVAFRKQLKLIDVLKRQRIHVESSQLLGFTEEEFYKTIDMSDRV